MKSVKVLVIIAAVFAASFAHAAPSSPAEAPVVKPEVVAVASDPCKGHKPKDREDRAGRGGRSYDLTAPVGCR